MSLLKNYITVVKAENIKRKGNLINVSNDLSEQ